MQAHIVLAHPESRSYNAHLAALARRALEEYGWQVSITDLYATGFDPCERPEHFAAHPPGERFDVQGAQRAASVAGEIPADVAAEIARLDAADLVILQYPMWWHLPPAMLKGWFDRVFIYNAVYASKRRFENGRFVGKRAMLSVTVGTSPETYAFNGRSGDMDLLLWPVNFTMAYVGFEVLAPFVAYGVEADLRYSDDDTLAKRYAAIEAGLRARMELIKDSPVIPFNRMAEWTADGHIANDAPAYSPFIRHQEELELG